MTTLQGPPIGGLTGIGALTMGAFLEEVAARFAPNEALVFDEPLRSGATRTSAKSSLAGSHSTLHEGGSRC